ncbi:MAG: hypothetical protein OJF48_002069 [Afipia sp.]|nr:MAG: hypothetical protein OJF48_002069 [Afipia sp.]
MPDPVESTPRPNRSWCRTLALCAAMAAAVIVTLFAAGAPASARSKSNQIQYEYVPPKDPAHQAIYDQMKQGRALENLQELLSPLRLPYPLKLTVAGCDGVPNAWYSNEVVKVCYELLAEFLKHASKQELPMGITRADTILGPVLDVFLHETGHAVYDMLQIPILGRQEDAADQFAAYVMLRLGKEEARKLILGAAYGYNIQMPQGVRVTMEVDAFSNEHSLPAQRAYNVLCIAYGADSKLFADVVELEFLPKKRAELCPYEYEDLTFAMTKLIGPHIDKRRAANFHEVWARTVTERRARLARP